MDHPIIKEEQKALRGRLVQLLRSGFDAPRAGNIVFVCGGNPLTDMRPRFQEYANLHMPEFNIFFPEFAMKDHFSGNGDGPFNIAEFEELVGDISHAIVIFPEGPGSFAETGYFSAKLPLARKTVLVLDSNLPTQDGFIGMGPASLITANSAFNPTINISYSEPDFSVIHKKIGKYINRYKKELNLENFKNLSNFELICLIQKLVQTLTICTIDDIDFLMRSIFSGKISQKKIRRIVSILVGAKYLEKDIRFGHFRANVAKDVLLTARPSKSSIETEIRLEMVALYANSSPEFIDIIETFSNAD